MKEGGRKEESVRGKCDQGQMTGYCGQGCNVAGFQGGEVGT